MAKEWALSTGNLPRGGLPRNSVDRITDRPDMTSAIDLRCQALTQTKQTIHVMMSTLLDGPNGLVCKTAKPCINST